MEADRKASTTASLFTSTRAVGTFDPVWGTLWWAWLSVLARGEKP